jgi:hypothetical protein
MMSGTTVVARIWRYIGLEEQMIVSDTKLPTKPCTVGVSFKKSKVGEKKIKTQLGAFSVAGEGFMVGRCAGAPVTPDYTGHHPWAFTGGTISYVRRSRHG